MDTLVYCDPPYQLETRKSETRYRHDWTDDDHRRFLKIALKLPCLVMISGYWSSLYDETLQEWRRISFPAMTRGGIATEYVWMNYPEPDQLQDYRYLGRDKRERFKLLRRRRNLLGKLRRLPPRERNALLMAIATEFGDCGRGR